MQPLNRRNYIIAYFVLGVISSEFRHEAISALITFILFILMYLRLKDTGKPMWHYIFMLLTAGLYGFFLSSYNNISSSTQNITNANYHKPIIYSAAPMHDDSTDTIFTKYPKFVRYKAFDGTEKSFWGECGNFTVIDFETANCYPDSVCQIGIVVVRNNEIVKNLVYKIKPPYRKFTNSYIHGIKLNDVSDAFTFGELWPSIKEYIENQVITAYNLPFDAGCLEALFKCYGIKNVPYAAFDILESARSNWPEFKNHKLVTVAEQLNINLNAHDAGSDAIAAAKVQLTANLKNNAVYIILNNNMTEFQKKDFSMMYAKFNQKFCLLKNSFESKQSDNITDYNYITQNLNIIIQNTKNFKDLAKTYRLYGEIFERCKNYPQALSCYCTALSYDENVGVKIKIKKMEKLIIETKEQTNCHNVFAIN